MRLRARALMAVALGLLGACREPDSALCSADRDCVSCTQSDCHFCLEDGMCLEIGQSCVGDVARTPGECEVEEEALVPPDAGPAGRVTR